MYKTKTMQIQELERKLEIEKNTTKIILKVNEEFSNENAKLWQKIKNQQYELRQKNKQIERIIKMSEQSAIQNVDVKEYMRAKGINFPNVSRKFYGIKDIKQDAFCEIVENKNDACMIRSLAMAVNDINSKTLISQRPEDFELWKLYEVDEVTGDVVQDKRKITNAVDYVNKQ